MPVRSKQWHYAQAPRAFSEALFVVSSENAHVRALSTQYELIISDPFPDRDLVHRVCEQIAAAQKRYIAAYEKLEVVSQEARYCIDYNDMVWLARPERRKYYYEEDQTERSTAKDKELCAEKEEVEVEEKGIDVTKEESMDGLGLSLLELNEMTSSTNIRYFDDEDSPTSPISDDDTISDSSSSSSSTISISSFPSAPLVSSPTPPVKRVRFLSNFFGGPSKRGIWRIKSRAEVEAEFQAANKVERRVPGKSAHRKRKACSEE